MSIIDLHTIRAFYVMFSKCYKRTGRVAWQEAEV